jgi:acyl transferase domain-containing protein
MDRAVAIVGSAGRFPGARTVLELWQRVCSGQSGVTFFSDRELAEAGIPARVLRDPNYVKAAAILDDVSGFDAAFFGMTPAEAEITDPQQRLLLECAHEALEDAGIDPWTNDSAIGVFCGASLSTYLLYNLMPTRGFTAHQCLPIAIGNDKDYIATAVSYRLNLRGPSVAVQTACSTSLVAVHLAIQSLLAGECDVALAGGVTLRVPQRQGYHYREDALFPPDGKTRAFDADAKGTIFGNGCGVVVLKRLPEALANGDVIDAVIIGSAVNNDGAVKVGFTAPGVDSQAAVIAEALAVAGVRADDLGLIEAHGTATAIGDPIELTALAQAFGAASGTQFCAIGSIKSNVGHLETAAGVTGLLKAALAVKTATLPPTLHFHAPTPRFDFQASPFYVNTETRSWPATQRPRRAGVSAFGIGGTNAHVIVQEPPLREPEASPDWHGPYLLPLSAKSEAALRVLAGRWATFLSESSEDLLCIVASAAMRRRHHEHRLVLVSGDRQGLARGALAFGRGAMQEGMLSGVRAASGGDRVAFVFPGQGSQWLGMGRELLAEPAFERTIRACHECFCRFVDWSLLDQLQATAETSRLDAVDVAQPVIFAMQVALAALWRDHGVEPTVVIGHSMGEVAAAHVAGVLSLEDAARVICERSRLVKQASGKGSMAVVELAEAELDPVLRPYGARAVIAALNGPRSSVISADPDVMTELLEHFERSQTFCRLIKVDYASHGPQMEPLLPELRRILRAIRPQRGRVELFSTTLQQRIDGTQMDAEYWCANLRKRVSFGPSVATLMAEGLDTFVEVSPNPSLLLALQDSARESGRVVNVVGSCSRERGELQAFRENVGRLHVFGSPLDWKRVYRSRQSPFVRLPTYPWERQHHWVGGQGTGYDLEIYAPGGGGVDTWDESLGKPLTSSLDGTRYWTIDLGAKRSPYRRGPLLELGRLVSAGALVGLLLAAARRLIPEEAVCLSDIRVPKPLFEGPSPPVLQVAARSRASASPSAAARAWEIRASAPHREGAEAGWSCHASGLASAWLENANVEPRGPVKTPCTPRSHDELYASLSRAGLRYTSEERSLAQVEIESGRGVATLQASALESDDERLVRSFEASLQLLHAIRLVGDGSPSLQLPVSIGRVVTRANAGRPSRIEANLSNDGPHALGSAAVWTDKHEMCLAIDGVVFEVPPRALHLARADFGSSLYRIVWRGADAPAVTGPSASAAHSPAHWLILDGGEAIGATLAEALRARGQRCTRVLMRDGRGLALEDGPRLGLGERDACAELLELLEGDEPLRGIVYLSRPASLEPESDCEDAAIRTLAIPVQLVRALQQRERDQAPRLFMLTRGALQVVEHDEVSDPMQASLWGFGMALMHEHPELEPTLIDLDAVTTAGFEEDVCNELLSTSWTSEVAFRDGRRYRAELVRGGLELGEDSGMDVCRPDRTYLISGGLGSIGMRSAEWLHARGARHLALVGRNPPSSAAHATISKLRDAGMHIAIVQADISQWTEASRAIAGVAREMPPLAGILHLASSMDDAALVSSTWERFLSALRPKVFGAWNLHRLTRDVVLDFFVSFSSVVSLTGSHGQASYVAANRFLDGFVGYRRRLGLPASAINWGAWDQPDKPILTTNAVRGLERFHSDVGLEVLRRVIRRDVARIGFVPGLDLELWLRHNPGLRSLPFFRQAADDSGPTAAESADVIKADLEAAPNAGDRQQRLEAHLQVQLARVLNLPTGEIDPALPFGSLGLNSLLGLELRRRLELALGLKLPATTVYNHPTCQRLAAHLIAKLGFASAQTPIRAAGDAARDVPTPFDAKTLEALSEQATERLLLDRLRSLQR